MKSKECRTCLKLLSIDEFNKHNGSFRLDCKNCFRKKERLRRVERLKKIDLEHANRVILHQEEIENRGECPLNHAWCYVCKSYKQHHKFSPYNLKNNGKCTECASRHDIERTRLLKLKAIEYKGNKCSRCGFIGHYSSYDFHHVDPTKKDFNWNVGRKKSFDKIKLELDKCILLCRNCHQMIHTKLNNDGSLNSEYLPTNVS